MWGLDPVQFRTVPAEIRWNTGTEDGDSPVGKRTEGYEIGDP